MRSIRNYLPKPGHQEKTEIVQARIPSAMKEEMKRLADKNHWKPSQIIRAGIQKFIEDVRS
jgi:predicted DNA-binding protein